MISSNTSYSDRWIGDTKVLANLRTSFNDKLEIVNDRLSLEEGKRSRRSGEAIMSNPQDIAKYLENAIKITAKEIFEDLKSSKNNSPEHYEKVADFNRQVKCLYRRLNSMQYTFRTHDCNKKGFANRYSELFNTASTFSKEVKEYKKTLKKPPLEDRPVKRIEEYNERTDLNSIKWTYPKRVPIKETVAAAKQALLLAQPKQPLPIKCFKAVG